MSFPARAHESAASLLLDIRKLSHLVAESGFLLLFPGFVFYHYAIASGWMPPIAGGLFGPVVLAISIYCLVVSFWLLRRDVLGSTALVQFFVIAWVYFLTWTAAGSLTVMNEPYGMAALGESALTLVTWLALFFVGAFYRPQAPLQRRVLWLAAAGFVGLFIHAAIVQDSPVGILLVFLGGKSDVSSSTYQGIGRSVMVVAIVLSVLSGRYGRQFVMLALAAALLLALGSRSHFFSILCVILATIFFAMIRGRSKIGPIVFVVVAALSVYAGWSFFLETRAAEVLDLGSSVSWQERQDVQSIAIGVIRQNPLVGDFAYHLRDLGPGGYAHNALSAWTQFGLIGFLLYVSLIVYCTLLSFVKSLSSRSRHGLWQIAFALNLSALVMAVAAEQVFSEVPALAWGFAVNALRADATTEVAA